jgi:hypothetical protein
MTAITILDRIDALVNKASFVEGKRATVAKNLKDTETNVANLEANIFKLEKVQKVLSALVDKLVKKDLSMIDDLVTYGLKTVFPDRELLFRSEMVSVGDKMQVSFTTVDNGVEVCEDAFGSVSVVESLILRIYCMNKMKTGKLLLLDETFSAIDHEYINRVGQLLHELAKSSKLDILLVTFNPGVSDATVLRAKLNTTTRELSLTKEGK